MKEFKGTPGPWRVTEIDDDNLSEMSSTMIIASELVVACVGPSNKTQLGDDKNNALLIAAAPELLEALIKLVDVVDDMTHGPSTDAAHAAINKALGE